MTDILKPRDAKDVEAAVQWALAEGKALAIEGRGSKRMIGRPSQTDCTIDLSGLTGVTLYEPEELVLSARAGTPLAEIEALVAAQGQELAFEPMDFGSIFGPADGTRPAGQTGGSIGGVLAANVSGPRRIKAGAARDHFLGFTAVSGRGETFRSGGRVVKNVTGYDLCKLMAGSWGTLAAMTDVTIKELPKAETEETVLILGLDPARAVAAMALAMRCGCDPSAAAHLPERPAARVAAVANAGGAVTAFRLEGVAPSVEHRKRGLEQVLRPYGTLAVLAAAQSRGLWVAIRDAEPFAARPGAAERPLWRLSTTPSKGAEVGARLAAEPDAELGPAAAPRPRRPCRVWSTGRAPLGGTGLGRKRLGVTDRHL